MASKNSSRPSGITRPNSKLPSNMLKNISGILADLKQEKALIRKVATSKSRPAGAMSPFGGVSELGIAPVTIGNTVCSVKQQVLPSRNGVRVVGRDFVMAVGGTSTIYSNWTLQAGLGLSPICLNATGLRGYFQTYERFHWNRVNVHYITSSPTSATGDVLIVYHSNHGGPKVDHTSSNFMSYALSTDSALLGPQWTNHSVQILSGERDWFNTDVLSVEDVMHQADGEVLVYTRNTTNGASPDQPGYILIDYDVTFERRMLNPRVQSLPSSLFKFQPVTFHMAGAPVLAGDTVSFDMGSVGTYTGGTVALPNGLAQGDVFQVVFDLQQATISGGLSFATGFSVKVSTGVNMVYPITTGTTLYAVCGSAAGTGAFALFPNYDAAMTGQAMVFSANSSPLIATPIIVCCVGSITPVFAQANIG